MPTGLFGTGHSIECDLGNALPDLERENYYKNQPIAGARFIAKAEAVGTRHPPQGVMAEEEPWEATYGQVFIVKNSQIISQWEPSGENQDILMIVWSADGREMIINNSDKGFVDIDLVSGKIRILDSGRSWTLAVPELG
jgi:hypothetical protein